MKNIIYYLLISLCAVSAFSSCISSEEINYLQAIDKQYPMQNYEEYQLKVGDMITCTILTSDEELAYTFNGVISNSQNAAKSFTIYEDGSVILPFFGSAKIVGYTIQEAEVVLQKMMEESIRDIQVKVSLANNFFFIYANEKRGTYQIYKDNMTIYQALAISQQTTGTMDLTKVSILRKNDQGKTDVKTFDLRTQDVIQSEFYYIQPNDLIYFPTNKNAFFDVSSIGAFTSALMVPLTFFLYSITYNF
ncbi:MAG: polysaccharide biosynthesis/export family protein [Dysgonomonas sp.]|nr:polysaccharide biosynthesis/export family protein [Dysgonomonas sp.]